MGIDENWQLAITSVGIFCFSVIGLVLLNNNYAIVADVFLGIFFSLHHTYVLLYDLKRDGDILSYLYKVGFMFFSLMLTLKVFHLNPQIFALNSIAANTLLIFAATLERFIYVEKSDLNKSNEEE